MKDKFTFRKLKLNKETISHLEQKEILGGASSPCPSESEDDSKVPTCVNHTCS